jgi:hypothetical protein
MSDLNSLPTLRWINDDGFAIDDDGFAIGENLVAWGVDGADAEVWVNLYPDLGIVSIDYYGSKGIEQSPFSFFRWFSNYSSPIRRS